MATLATVNNSSKPGKLVLLWMAVLAWMPVHILAVFMDQTMNTHFLSLLQWLTVLTGSTWAPVHPRKTLYKVPQGFSIPGKQFLMNSSQHSGHLYWIRSWIETLAQCIVAHSTVWLHLDTFTPMEDGRSTALPQTTRLLDTWKDCSAMKASQYSGHLCWIKPWIHTFWACCSG